MSYYKKVAKVKELSYYKKVAKVKELSYYKKVARIERLPNMSGRIGYINHGYNRE